MVRLYGHIQCYVNSIIIKNIYSVNFIRNNLHIHKNQCVYDSYGFQNGLTDFYDFSDNFQINTVSCEICNDHINII